MVPDPVFSHKATKSTKKAEKLTTEARRHGEAPDFLGLGQTKKWRCPAIPLRLCASARELAIPSVTPWKPWGQVILVPGGGGMSTTLPFPLVTADPAGWPLPSAVPEPPSPLASSALYLCPLEGERPREPYAFGREETG